MIDFSFIIPAYNEEKLLPQTLTVLNSILCDISKHYYGEIIVVDNNSTDKTSEIASSAGAIVIFKEENCIAAARNAGANVANGKYFIFVDADTQPDIEVVKKSLDLMSSGMVCGGGAKVQFDMVKLPFFARLIVFWWESVTFFIPLAAGSYLFCLADAWRDTGGFNEKLYASEEVNFSYKLKKWGRKNKNKFVLLSNRVLTSSRKVQWHSSAYMFFFIMLNCICPFLVRSKFFCNMWYKRPN
jgi:glycosyltransferase involved in cell wall biosynthesis